MNRFSIFAVAALVLGGTFASGQGTKAKSPSPPRAEQAKWIRTPIGSSEMTVELPGSSKATPVQLEQKVRASYDILETVSYSGEGFAAFASYAVLKASTPISLDGAARGALDRVKGQAAAADYKETITPTTVAGLPGRKIQCSFTNAGKKLFLTGVLFSDRTRMWQVICTGEASAANSAMATRVVGSVKRTSGQG